LRILQKYFTGILMTILLSSTTVAQTANHFQFKKNIPGNYIDLNVDALENIYVVTADYQLKKMNSDGLVLFVYNNTSIYRKPTQIDVTNPLKILLYYEPLGFIITLDKLLTVRNKFNIHTVQYFNIPAIASSYDNNIWIYDGEALKVKKIDDRGVMLTESQEMSVFGDKIPEHVSLLADEKQVLLYDEKKGFYCFDWSGTFKEVVIPFLNWKYVGLNGKTVYGFKGNKLMLYEWQSLNLKEIDLPDGLTENYKMKVINKKLYVLANDGVRIYDID